MFHIWYLIVIIVIKYRLILQEREREREKIVISYRKGLSAPISNITF